LKPPLTEKWRRFADIMDYAIDNQSPGDLTIYSDAQAAISRVGHTGTRPGQDRSIRVVQAYSAGLGKVGVRGSNGFQGIPELLEMRGPISSLARQLQREDTGEHPLHGSKNGSHSILQSQKILKLIKAKKLLLPQHRRNPSWIELRIGLRGLVHRFGLGIGCVHHISTQLGYFGKNRYRINAGGVASIESPVPTSFSGTCTLNSKVHAKISGTAQTKMAR
jgi:hypothetical protein